MDRRSFLAFGAGLLVISGPAGAQTPKNAARVGLLSPGDSKTRASAVDAVRETLHGQGWVEGDRAMVASGTLLLVEGVVRPGNEPDVTKLFDLNMMVLAAGRERTAAEYQALLEAAGFAMARIIPTPSVMGVSVIEATRARSRDWN
ncbi:MAG: hypothetical protein DME04_07500 [Candidatus Rokuibacteriota bacterium]|nr:MAG: hypothetical protein DME04_07500 [Candidatus Rokubacteria bacterium]